MDDLDAKVNAFQEYIREARDEESDWTPYHRLFERYIYKGRKQSDGETGKPDVGDMMPHRVPSP
jgi:3'-5' exoribonuclease